MNLEKNFSALQNLRQPKAVIFDWDNTLVDTWPLIARAINNTMRFMQKEEWSLTKVKDTVHKSMRESFPELFGDDWQKAGEVYKQSYRDVHLSELRLLPQALELLNILQQKNILAFLVSNKIGTTLRKEVKNLELTDKFFSVVGSMDSAKDKPSLDPVELALSASNIDMKQDHIWFVGDTIADVECAYNMKAQPIIYGHDDAVSKTIPPRILENGKHAEGAIPLYFNHGELIKVLQKF
jgi:phosphoglycolate phosphatase